MCQYSHRVSMQTIDQPGSEIDTYVDKMAALLEQKLQSVLDLKVGCEHGLRSYRTLLCSRTVSCIQLLEGLNPLSPPIVCLACGSVCIEGCCREEGWT